VGAIGLRASGGFVAALASGFALIAPDGACRTVAAVAGDPARVRLNDGKCDRRGRFWAGSLDMSGTEPLGALYRLDPDFACASVAQGVTCANSLAFSPDDRTLYFADSPARAICAYAFDIGSGELGPRRVFADTSALSGVPDGSTVDAEGFLWNAMWDGWRLVRYAPDGRVDRIVPLPVQRPTCCAFGGPKLETLFVTSARASLEPQSLAAQPLAGSVLAFEPGCRGLAEPLFQG
jgi:L-arabinonolactonase